MTAAKKLDSVSVEDFLAGELKSRVKHEYVGGRIYAMAGGRNVHHALSTAFVGLLYNRLRGRPCQPFGSDAMVRLKVNGQTRFYYPDGMVVCEPNSPNDQFHDKPVVIAEVLSKSTRRIDEGEKLAAYLTIPTLATYLLIESDRRRVVAYERAGDDFVRTVYEGRDAIIPLPLIETTLPLSELYERVTFEDERL